MPNNPWIDRFNVLTDEVIEQRMRCIPEPYVPSRKSNSEIITNEVGNLLSRLYVPTQKALNIATHLVGLANAHSYLHYKSELQYISDTYQPLVPLDVYFPSVNITGLAGVGKSALACALLRCLDHEVEVPIKEHEPHKLRIIWSQNYEGQTSPTGMLLAFLVSVGVDTATAKKDSLLSQCRREAFQRGISLSIMDETQFQAFSASASAAVAKVLITHCMLGIPNVYFSNYNLGHKLKKRPQQDRQRLLSRPIVLMPDTEDSDEWREYITVVQDLLSEIVDLDIESDLQFIHYATSGIRRLVGDLLLIAIQNKASAHRSVTRKDLELAFKSTSYTVNREDVKLLYQQFRTGKQANKTREDLWCPFSDTENYFQDYVKTIDEVENNERMMKLAELAMTPDEKSIHKKIQRNSKHKCKNNVTPIRKGKSTLEDLKKANDEFKDSL